MGVFLSALLASAMAAVATGDVAQQPQQLPQAGPADGMPRAGAMPQQPTIVAAPAAPASPGEGYRLGVNDEVEISIFAAQNQVVRTRVKEDGSVTVPFVGVVQARDLTARELSARIASQLQSGGFFVKPIVNVDVTQFISNVVTVLGNVATPGIYPLDRDMTTSMIIARAGGSRSDGADYAMLRRRGDDVQHRVEFGGITGDWNGATRLVAGDTVYIPPIPLFFAYGQVNSPGAFPIRSGMTVRQALARAGGPTLAGSQNSVTIYRGDVKLKKVKLDEQVEPDDTIYVNERLF